MALRPSQDELSIQLIALNSAAVEPEHEKGKSKNDVSEWSLRATAKGSKGRTVARVFRVDALNVRVLGEKVHENRFDGFALVDNGFCADVETANGLGVNIELLHEVVDD